MQLPTSRRSPPLISLLLLPPLLPPLRPPAPLPPLLPRGEEAASRSKGFPSAGTACATVRRKGSHWSGSTGRPAGVQLASRRASTAHTARRERRAAGGDSACAHRQGVIQVLHRCYTSVT
eukprot:6029920-Pyramimonas_sp.AAC.1